MNVFWFVYLFEILSEKDGMSSQFGDTQFFVLFKASWWSVGGIFVYCIQLGFVKNIDCSSKSTSDSMSNLKVHKYVVSFRSLLHALINRFRKGIPVQFELSYLFTFNLLERCARMLFSSLERCARMFSSSYFGRIGISKYLQYTTLVTNVLLSIRLYAFVLPCLNSLEMSQKCLWV